METGAEVPLSAQRPSWLDDEDMTPTADAVIAGLQTLGLHLGVAESLTGGLVTDKFVTAPGASTVLWGGVVAYATPVKHTVLGVDAELLEKHGPVHPMVAEQMARGVRKVVAVDGKSAEVGVSTTGVAGPDPQGGQPPGTVFIGLAWNDEVFSYELSLSGDRDEIRRATVGAVMRMLGSRVDA